MVEYLQEFLVLKEGGKVIYCLDTDTNLIKDEVLFGGFLEAINAFYNLSLNDDLNQIEGRQYRITFLTKGEYQFIGISPMNIKNEKALNELNFFADKFIELFPESLLNNCESDVRIFHSFNSEIIKTKKDYLIEKHISSF